MNLDQVTLEIRPRTAWEAVDLGLLMARRWWLPMTKIWLIVSLPILLIALLIPTDKWWVSALLIWWLKPLYERPLLHILSRAVFNDLPDTRSTLKAFKSFAFKQLFLSLTWRRLSPTRSMDLAIVQLEGLSDARRQERLGVLHREDSSPANWIGFFGLMMEFSLWTGMITLIWAFIPRELNIEWAGLFFSDESVKLIELQIVIWYCALLLTAPFYVACGFALYLNRRVKLEAWDIDIAFRRIANKRMTPSSLNILAIALSTALFLLIASTPDIAYADEAPTTEQTQTPEPTPTSEHLPGMEADSADDNDEIVIDKPLDEYRELNRDSAHSAIKEVMQQSEFSRKEKVSTIKWDEPEEEEEKEPAEFWKKLFDSLRDFKGFVAAASLLEILLWAGVVALAVFVFYRYRHWLAAQFVRTKPAQVMREKPVTLFGMDVTRESLPADISRSALDLLRSGDNRAALALLYRASLFQLIHSGVEIQDGHTEGECVQLMRDHVAHEAKTRKTPLNHDVRTDYFALLTRVWQQLAYGHQNPEVQIAEQLCQQWNSSWLNHTDSQRSTGSQGGAQ
ncbi:MAG: hypothetical protein B0W54_10660 [Cellvibrio sp. 79]|nr:MAG: hypothetical protein B0W54_10660 [Cellvibrio sp. 79]